MARHSAHGATHGSVEIRRVEGLAYLCTIGDTVFSPMERGVMLGGGGEY